jgi:hypothetical protein
MKFFYIVFDYQDCWKFVQFTVDFQDGLELEAISYGDFALGI